MSYTIPKRRRTSPTGRRPQQKQMDVNYIAIVEMSAVSPYIKRSERVRLKRREIDMNDSVVKFDQTWTVMSRVQAAARKIEG